MEYVHIRSLEKYHPGYKDRELKYGKMFFSLVQGDPEFELIDNEIDKWRFMAMVCLELEAKKPLPNTDAYWSRKGFDLKKRPMSLTLKMLHNFIEVVTEDSQIPIKTTLKSNVNDNIKDNIYVDWEQSTFTAWNSFCNKHPSLSKIKEITASRRSHLKQRFEQQSFKDFPKLLSAIEQQPFLLNGNPNSKDHKNWRVDFDWLISNDTNFVKVLEFKYKNNGDESSLERKFGVKEQKC